VNDSRYALQNAFIYTVLVALILLAPLYVYTVYMKNIHEIRNELLLKQHAGIILQAMNEFGTRHEETFSFPRFQLFQAGLYDRHFKPIFSLIEEPFENFSPGYHNQGDYVYFIMPLPEHRYFDANYLIVGNELSFAAIYEKVATILLVIAILVFLLSLLFLNHFAAPFRQVNKKLDNFIKDSVHEINTPLSIINVNIDLFNRKNPENKYLMRIKAAAKSLANIYNDMDYIIKNEKKGFTSEEIELDTYLKERIEYISEIAAMQNIRIESQINCRARILFSSIKLQRIIDNNLSNAIKYSNQNTVIYVRLDAVGDRCVLSFTDNGIGIAEPKKIFERYYREKSDKSGFGIGLNIVKQIIDDAGISLKITSVLGKGSSFSYTFPPEMLLSPPSQEKF
jgi:signal transduction histidine kinase